MDAAGPPQSDQPTFIHMRTLYSKTHRAPLFGQEEFSWQLHKWNSGSPAAIPLKCSFLLALLNLPGMGRQYHRRPGRLSGCF
jgi:hypothetical protein